MKPNVMLISGDHSSDRIGSALARKISEECPDTQLFGVGGPLMEEAGVRLLYDLSELVSLGVLKSPKSTQIVVKRLLGQIIEKMQNEAPTLVVQIGLPVFGLKLLEIAQTREIPVLYYGTPLGHGLENIKPSYLASVVDKVACVSRMEFSLCENADIPCVFVGHPFHDLPAITHSSVSAREELGIHTTKTKVLAILPGEREIEVKNVLPAALKTLSQMQADLSNVQIVISPAPTISTVFLEEFITNNLAIHLSIERDTRLVLDAADVAITSTGLCSLEAALLGVPSLVVYRVPCTTYFAEKLVDRTNHLTITNNILGTAVVPEFIQSDFNYGEIGVTLHDLMNNSELQDEIRREFKRLDYEVGTPSSVGSVAQVAQIVIEMAGCESDGEAFS